MLAVLRSEGEDLSCRRGPLYRFPVEAMAASQKESGGFLLDSMFPRHSGNTAALGPTFSPLLEAANPNWPMVVARVDHEVVSVCFGAPSAYEVGVEARVQTLSGHRRRGLGRACLVAWGRVVAQAGAIPLAQTEWENRGACAFAQNLGLEIYGDSVCVEF